MILSYYSEDSEDSNSSSVESKALTSEREDTSSTTSQHDEQDSLLVKSSPTELDNDQDDSDIASKSSIDDDISIVSEISGFYKHVANPQQVFGEEDIKEICNYCHGKVDREECKICSCGLVCCGVCYESVFKCGYLCDFTCEHCCDLGVYCSRRAILQCEKCSVDHRQRCGCDCINTPDESSDDEERRGCDYCDVEHTLNSLKRCACGAFCCSECLPKVAKCGYACVFTCEDCCDGVYCSREGYLQCKLCSADHTERCGCNDIVDGTEYSSEVSQESVENSEEFSLDTNSDDSNVPYNFSL